MLVFSRFKKGRKGLILIVTDLGNSGGVDGVQKLCFCNFFVPMLCVRRNHVSAIYYLRTGAGLEPAHTDLRHSILYQLA